MPHCWKSCVTAHIYLFQCGLDNTIKQWSITPEGELQTEPLNTILGKVNLTSTTALILNQGCGHLAKLILAQGQLKDHNTILGKVHVNLTSTLILNQGYGKLAKLYLPRDNENTIIQYLER